METMIKIKSIVGGVLMLTLVVMTAFIIPDLLKIKRDRAAQMLHASPIPEKAS